MSKTNPARGMRDYLPADVRKRNYVTGVIKEVYESYGFEPLETPAVENLDTLTGKYGDEGNQLIFKILKRGDKLEESLKSDVISPELESPVAQDSRLKTPDSNLSDLALRYDLTVPLARVVANNKNELPKFFKRYQIQPVWRADRPGRGRFREFHQCDVDAIGSSSMIVEAELISAVSGILTKLGFEDFTFWLNHREVLRGMLNAVNIPEAKHSDAFVAIDKLDKIGTEGVMKEFHIREIPFYGGEKILKILQQTEELKRTFHLDSEQWNIRIRSELGTLGDLNVEDEIYNGLGDLHWILNFSKGTAAENRVRIDPSLARGLSYYTGTIMEINVPDLAGSLGGGGRYDGLIGMFGKEQIPACGFSLGLERILVVMDERGMFPPEIAESTPADVMVTLQDEESIAESLKLASELRSSGLRATVYPEPDKLGKQLKYADAIRVPYACILGETEIAEGKVTVKNMKTSEQISISRSNITEYLRAVSGR